MKLTIVYDNEALEGFKDAWGFACLVDNAQERILFDAGGNAKIMAHNMARLGIARDSIDKIVISHDHWDHTGGLEAVVHEGAAAYLPTSASKELLDSLKDADEAILVDRSMKLSDGIHSTGTLACDIPEQVLALETEKGIVVVTGCAHPGLGAILDRAESFGKVAGVLGGFHGFDEVARLERLEILGPCHCTERLDEIRRMYPDTVARLASGVVLEI